MFIDKVLNRLNEMFPELNINNQTIIMNDNEDSYIVCNGTNGFYITIHYDPYEVNDISEINIKNKIIHLDECTLYPDELFDLENSNLNFYENPEENNIKNNTISHETFDLIKNFISSHPIFPRTMYYFIISNIGFYTFNSFNRRNSIKINDITKVEKKIDVVFK